jgi:hypothetical protein
MVCGADSFLDSICSQRRFASHYFCCARRCCRSGSHCLGLDSLVHVALIIVAHYCTIEQSLSICAHHCSLCCLLHPHSELPYCRPSKGYERVYSGQHTQVHKYGYNYRLINLIKRRKILVQNPSPSTRSWSPFQSRMASLDGSMMVNLI